MSWRLFLTLVNNLSARGAVAHAIMLAQEKNDDNNPADDEAAANAFFASVVSV